MSFWKKKNTQEKSDQSLKVNNQSLQAQPDESHKCPRCGAGVPIDAQFCNSCGERIGTQTQENVATGPQTVRVFISYSHENDIWLRPYIDKEEKEKNKRYFLGWWNKKYEKRATFWWDREIRGGDRWRNKIYEHIDNADIAVLFITKDFIASDFIMKEEMPRIMARTRRNALEILPILLQPADYQELQLDGIFQITPGKPTPLSKFLPTQFDNDWEEALLEITTSLDNAIKRVITRREKLQQVTKEQHIEPARVVSISSIIPIPEGSAKVESTGKAEHKPPEAPIMSAQQQTPDQGLDGKRVHSRFVGDIMSDLLPMRWLP